MSAETLAFLQNFYTDVTLYVPAEPGTAAPGIASENLAAPAAPTAPAKPVVPVPPARLPGAAVAAALAIATPPSAEEPAAATAPVAPPAAAASAPSVPVAAVPAPPVPGPTSVPANVENPRPAPAAGAPLPAGPAVPPAQLTPFATLGSRADGVVLLVRLPPDQFHKLHRNVFLNKMLQALGLVMADVVLVNVESHLPVALSSLRRELAATQVVAFGRNLLDVTVRNTQIYEPVQFAGQNLSYLAAAEIEMVEYDVSLKKRLWPGLQRMFLR
ncbi:hypothetical protein [Hymenobacter sp. PAMC 26628]|uniref:hypothetical protein n=1 Tax=Hymenobacter sp. PAMC 26628 TaxID=1484118 RepID=UPI0007703D8C|nr:hypothetical protein [Hymenobacter sp. PAMC 26628]AMJ65677.1 hypothetical protein AXW84_09740 [Hymenobacter sp. PAMC 26628]